MQANMYKDRISERIIRLLKELNLGIYEKETEIGLSLLAALAGESVLLLGPPGVAKSMVARRLKEAFAGARSFEYLMSRFSTPDEIFGPVSINRLKESDKYERCIEGYLPTSDVVFLDEIWKAGPAIQNALLTAINEKLFRNGDKEIRLPMKLLIAASNELPAQGEGLEALWDRFLIRLTCSCVKDEKVFFQMLLDEESEETGNIDLSLKITSDEYKEWQKAISKVELSQDVLTCIAYIRKHLGAVRVEGEEHLRKIYISDRRWKHIVRLLKASAFVHGREYVSVTDLLPIAHCLWNEPEEQQGAKEIVVRSLFDSIQEELTALNRAIAADLRIVNVRSALKEWKGKGPEWFKQLKIVNHFYFQLENHGTGHTFIFLSDFLNLPEYNAKNAPRMGVMYPDPRDSRLTIIRCFSVDSLERMPDARQVNLRRKEDKIYIDGVEFHLRKLSRGERQEELGLFTPKASERDYGTEVEQLLQKVVGCTEQIKNNLFVTDKDCRLIKETAEALRKQIAYTRQDIEKLYS